MSLQTYTYSSLTAPSTFRLLRLCKAGHNGPEVEIFEQLLTSSPRYDAISYCWEGQQPSIPLRCSGGAQILVTENVMKILRILQRPDSDLVLWVDSVCINQGSDEDKNTQVAMMGEIYKQAAKVVIWLGGGSYETDTALEYLADVANISRGSAPTSTKMSLVKQRKATFEGAIAQRRVYGGTSDTSFINDIFQRPWFNRMWTLQEAVLARQSVLTCGDKRLPWDDFSAALDFLRQVEVEFFASHNNHAPGLSFNEGRLKGQLHPFEACKVIIRSLKESPSLHRQLPTCGIVVSKTRRRRAGNPRDKVYGLYGILAECGVTGLPAVDYKQAVNEIYTDFTRAAILSDPHPYVLFEIQANPRDGLPSWVPDYDDQTESLIYLDTFAASKQSPWIFSFEPGDRLGLYGIIVDTVRDVARSKSRNSANEDFTKYYGRDRAGAFRLMIQELSQTFQDWVRVVGEIDAPQYPSGDSVVQAFFHTLHGDANMASMNEQQKAEGLRELNILMTILSAKDPVKGRGMDSVRNDIRRHPMFHLMQDIWRSKGYDGDLLAEEDDDVVIWANVQLCPAQTLLASMGFGSYGRTLYTTHGGYMGLGPRSAQEGDLIVLFSGISAPFILRAASRTGSQVGDWAEMGYRMIGPAYIYGMMEGQLWADDTVTVPITIL